MSAAELCRLIVNWADALTLAEMIDNSFFNVGKQWDLHDWHVEEHPEGLRFWRLASDAHTVTSVTVLSPEDGEETSPPPAIWTETSPVEVVCS